MSWKQFLTEKVLKECYHDGRTPFNCGFKCRKCGNTFTTNRTFDNRNDMMDLYEAIYKSGPKEWGLFINFVFEKEGLVVTPTLFCLSGEGYEERCKMVAEFYGWEDR